MLDAYGQKAEASCQFPVVWAFALPPPSSSGHPAPHWDSSPSWGLLPSPQGSAVCRTDSPLPAQGPTGLGVTILCELFWDPCSLTRNTVGQEGSFAWRVGHPAEQISWLTCQGPTTRAGYSVARNCFSLRTPLRPSETRILLLAAQTQQREVTMWEVRWILGPGWRLHRKWLCCGSAGVGWGAAGVWRLVQEGWGEGGGNSHCQVTRAMHLWGGHCQGRGMEPWEPLQGDSQREGRTSSCG